MLVVPYQTEVEAVALQEKMNRPTLNNTDLTDMIKTG
jgi:hypothetical protein